MSQRASFMRSLAPLISVTVRGGVAVLLVGLGVGVAWFLFVSRPAPPKRPEAPPPRPVETIVATAFDLPRVWRGYGTAASVREANVAAEVAAQVLERPAAIEAGQWVRPGEVLARLDDRDFRAQVRRSEQLIAALEAVRESLGVEEESLQDRVVRAENAVTLTEREIELLEATSARGGASPIELTRLRRELTSFERTAMQLRQELDKLPARRAELLAQIEAERATLNVARLNVERTTIAAPIEGVLQAVFIDTGDRVSVGAPIARIVDPRRIEAPVKLPLSASAEVSVGDAATFRASSAAPGAALPATVVRILPEAEASERAIAVVIEAEQAVEPGRPPRIVPGSFILAEVRVASDRPRIIVPRRAVRDDRVLTVGPDGVVGARPVEVRRHVSGRFEGVDPDETEWAVVERGLSAGERVIVSNLDELRPDAIVRAVDVGGVGVAGDADAGAEGGDAAPAAPFGAGAGPTPSAGAFK